MKEQVESVAFSISGEWIENFIKQQFFLEHHDINEIIEKLMNFLKDDTMSEHRRRRYAEDILLGRAALKGSTHDDSYHLEVYDPEEQPPVPDNYNLWHLLQEQREQIKKLESRLADMEESSNEEEEDIWYDDADIENEEPDGDVREQKHSESDFNRYIEKALNKLGNSNIITDMDLSMSDDLRIGIYYVATIYGLKLCTHEHGTWRWHMLMTEDGDNGLNAKEIRALPIKQPQYEKLLNDFLKEGPPKIKKSPKEKEYQPYGWLFPDGTYEEADWGDHEKKAEEIIKRLHMEKGYQKWKQDQRTNNRLNLLRRDFLIDKGWCLIHNPSASGGYIVSHTKPLTKKQKEFLYGFFADIGDMFKAEQYID